MPDCPVCKKAHPPACGWRLYGSQNECPICLENKATMIALPCGHQFCEQDLRRLGMQVVQRPPPAVAARAPAGPAYLRRPGLLVTVPNLTRVIARQRTRRLRVRRRCGWCGHIGHTQRKCKAHRRQCGCSTYKRARHKRLYALKNKCVVCFKKGHHFRSCAKVVPGFKRL